MAYISREKAIEIVKSGGYWEREDMEVAVACIEQTPTADVVEVVRCEKCIHSEDYNGRILCNKNAHIFDKNDFCSYGTPKERGGEK